MVLGQTVAATVDSTRRQAVRRAHSATHILQHALRSILGQHAEQQGSKVDEDILRFDFTNPKAVDREKLREIEDAVNAKVAEGLAIGSSKMPLAEARELGATMLFGEKYPDIVRVVAMGDFSKELCGGTHLVNTGQVGLVKIIGEESVAAGTRRITALTGRAALEHVHRMETALSQTAATLKVPADEVPARVESMLKEIRHLKKLSATGPKSAGTSADGLLDKAEEIAGVKAVIAEVPDADAEQLRQMIDQLRRKAAPIAVMLAAPGEEGKVMLVAGLSRDLVERGLDAVKWVRAAAKLTKGGGGGRPDMAQAGGKDASKIQDALKKARADLAEALAS